MFYKCDFSDLYFHILCHTYYGDLIQNLSSKLTQYAKLLCIYNNIQPSPRSTYKTSLELQQNPFIPCLQLMLLPPHAQASLVAHMERVCLQCGRAGFDSWFGKLLWRREWQLTLLFFPGKSHGQRTLAGYSPWGCKETDMTE